MDDKIVAFKEYVVSDVLAGIPGITSRAMFGGYGIYQDGFVFGLIVSDHELFFKVDDSNRGDFEKAGSHAFVYEQGNHKKTTMNYWKVPDEILEDKDEIKIWVRKAVEVSKNAKKK